MYGYLKNPYHKTQELYIVYRSYYCGLCNALKKNYGNMASMLLSYDIAFIGIILSPKSHCVKCSKNNCCIRKRRKKINKEYANKFWKFMVEFTLAMAYAKIQDNILDDGKSIKNVIRHKLVNSITKKARKGNETLYKFIKDKMFVLNEMEKAGCTVEEQGDYFSVFVLDVIEKHLEFSITKKQKNIIVSLVKWLCLVDALDDFERDIKSPNNINPIHFEFVKTSEELSNTFEVVEYEGNILKGIIHKNYLAFTEKYSNIVLALYKEVSLLKNKDKEDQVVYDMVNIYMPNTFFEILKENTK